MQELGIHRKTTMNLSTQALFWRNFNLSPFHFPNCKSPYYYSHKHFDTSSVRNGATLKLWSKFPPRCRASRNL